MELSANTLKFMIIDECPVSVALNRGQNCKQYKVGEVRHPLPFPKTYI
jgi:hypothetical protein